MSHTVKVRMHLKLDGEDDTHPIDIIVHPEWAPLGAARFVELIDANYFDECLLYRVVNGFIVQWGIPASPAEWKKWGANKIKDDPVKQKNLAGTLSFATSGEDSRGSQIFVNMADNSSDGRALGGSDGSLDNQGFAPFAELANIDDIKIFAKCHMPKGLAGVDQDDFKERGNAYALKYFPKLAKWTGAEKMS